MPSRSRARRLVGGGLFLAAAVATTVTLTRTPPATAADPFVAGQRGRAVTAVGDATSRVVADRAQRSAAALGLPGATRRVVNHVVDRFGGDEYDEVTEFDGRGRMTALQRFGAQGAIRSAVRFGWQANGGPRLAGDAAVLARAGGLASAVGVRPDRVGRIVRSSTQTGWTVSWDRTVEGARVLGDGIRIQLWPDGSFHSLSVSEHTLAGRPAQVIDQTTALRVARDNLDRWFAGPDRAMIATTTAELVWTAPNDTFAPDRPDAQASVYRLAWRVRATASGTLAGRLRALEIDVDAGDGHLLGGDVLE